MSVERLAVIGDPVAHSLSPAMHSAALKSAGLPWTYDAHLVRAGGLGDWMRTVRDAEYRGFNCTIPHKLAACEYVDQMASSGLRAGAVNTVVRDEDRYVGHNTDVAGFAASLLAATPDIWDIRAVVFGTGGAARAVVLALADLGSRTTVVSRRLERARALADLAERSTAMTYGDTGLVAELRQAQLIVNATPMGMSHLAGQSPLPSNVELTSDTLVMDLIYGRRTPFMARAEAQGCRTTDGTEMLVRQGAESFLLWTGMEADIAAMREACHRGLEVSSLC